MGKRIAELAPDHGLRVEAIIDNEADWQQKAQRLSDCSVALEFSTPVTALNNITRLLEMGIPVVSGTTGWDEHIADAAEIADRNGVGLMVASNFSVGMNLFFALNSYLAGMMNHYSSFQPSVEETHHIHKLDAPSGTAKSLVNELVAKLGSYHSWAMSTDYNHEDDVIPVTSIREGEVTGVHEVAFKGVSDMISVRHEAFNRDGFVLGAIDAAKWIIGRKGLLTMKEMLFGNE